MVLNYMYSRNSTLEEPPRRRIAVASSLNELFTDQQGNSAGISCRPIYGGYEPSRNWVVVPALQATLAGGIDSRDP
jgi:hypothetical protein